MQDLDLCYMSANQVVARYEDGSLSPVEATRAHLARLDAVEPAINAFMHVDHETALDEARASENRWRTRTTLSALDGVTVTIKDLIPMRDRPLRHGSATTSAEPSGEDAPSVLRLREAGCVFLGKTTTPEFGWKGLTDGPLFGTTRNPWNLAHSPGGSSGGAAAALAAGIGHLALGNDGGGSIRIPSAWSGLYGLKPTFGRVPDHPREGIFCMSSAEGPMTRSVTDAALMLNELSRYDASDWYALPVDGRNWSDCLQDGIDGLRVAFVPDLAGAHVDGNVRRLVDAALGRLQDVGALVEEVQSPVEPLEPVMSPFWLAGFAAFLRSIPLSYRACLDPRFRILAERGNAVTVAQLQESVVCRDRLGSRLNKFHEHWDLLVTPAMTRTAPLADTPYHSHELHRWRDVTPFSLPFNLTGQPAASVFCGIADDGLPVGLQIVAAKFREDLVLAASRVCEKQYPQRWPQEAVETALARTPSRLRDRTGEEVL